jgi:hypothetical protein
LLDSNAATATTTATLYYHKKHSNMDVLVFSTSVSDNRQINKVSPLLTAIKAIKDWNFDLEDCDHVLRVVANNISPRYIESVIQTAGFNCVELE